MQVCDSAAQHIAVAPRHAVQTLPGVCVSERKHEQVMEHSCISAKTKGEGFL